MFLKHKVLIKASKKKKVIKTALYPILNESFGTSAVATTPMAELKSRVLHVCAKYRLPLGT